MKDKLTKISIVRMENRVPNSVLLNKRQIQQLPKWGQMIS